MYLESSQQPGGASENPPPPYMHLVTPSAKRRRTGFEEVYKDMRAALRLARDQNIMALMDRLERSNRHYSAADVVPEPQMEEFRVFVGAKTTSLGLELSEHERGVEIKKVVDNGVAQQSCCFFVGDVMLYVGQSKLAGKGLQAIAGSISADWARDQHLNMLIGRYNSVSLQITAELAPYQYTPSPDLVKPPNCGVASSLRCGDSKVFLLKNIKLAGLIWQVALIGYRSVDAAASNDMEVDLMLKWCPREAWEKRRENSTIKEIPPVTITTALHLKLGTNGEETTQEWEHWKKKDYLIHEGERVVLDLKDFGRMSELTPFYMQESGTVEMVLDLSLVEPEKEKPAPADQKEGTEGKSEPAEGDGKTTDAPAKDSDKEEKPAPPPVNSLLSGVPAEDRADSP